MRTLALLSLMSFSPVAFAGSFTADQKTEIQGIIKEYLVNSPEVTQAALDSLKEKIMADDAQRQQDLIKANLKQLKESPTSPTGGNPNGDITIVEFFDYNCGYCRLTKPILNGLIAADPGLRVVYKEFPILSEASAAAARAALAAHRQGKYDAYHQAIFELGGRASQSDLEEIAGKVGLDIEKWKTDLAAPEVTAEIEQTAKLARTLGVTGTPAFIIGEKFYPGARDLEAMKAAVAEAREAAKKAPDKED